MIAHAAPRHVCASRTAGFTLIELLVVVAIVAMLIAVLMPALSRARAQSRLSVCLSNQHEIGLAIQAYAMQNNDAIPRGPDVDHPFFPAQRLDEWATNRLWIGDNGLNQAMLGFGATYEGLGPLLERDLTQPRVLYCPADDTNDPIEEFEKVERRGEDDAYCSYYYRQRDQTTRDRLDNLGENALGLPARALLLDANSLGADDFWRTNHQNRQVNVLYLDGHAETFDNEESVFSIRAEDFYGFPVSVERRLNEILVAADYAETADPRNTPPLP